jgi:hypothetical protein
MAMLEQYFKRMRFRMRWMAMSERKRYAYLWRQTQEGRQVAYPVVLAFEESRYPRTGI